LTAALCRCYDTVVTLNAHARRILLTLVVLTVPPVVPVEPASAEPATFDPVPSTPYGDPSVYGRVVSDGRGTFHSIVREDSPQQTIVYRRSRDGGLSWQVLGRWAGDAGGAQRPWIAVDGDNVIVSYIGAFDVGNGTYSEAPYIVTSTSSGGSWTAPKRLGADAFDVRVAVDANRWWVAWRRKEAVELRGYATNGSTFVSKAYPVSAIPHLAAADGAMGLVVGRTLVIADGTTLYLPQPLGDLVFTGSIAARDGWLHLAGMYGAEDDRRIGVASAHVPSGGALGEPVEVMPVSATGPKFDQAPIPYWSAITATRGTVAIAISGSDGATRVAASSDHGASFSSPVIVTSSSIGSTPHVQIGASTVPDDVPVARFDWSVPPRFVDTDGDKRPDPVTDASQVAEARTLKVRLDGTRSLPPTGASIANCVWVVDDQPVDAGLDCRTTIEVDAGSKVDVRLILETDDGRQATQVQTVAPRDYLVVSIGDSIASGEGNPNVPASLSPFVSPTWDDRACHRTSNAGPAQAAAALERADPRSSVTFIHLACSGAAMVDTPETAGAAPSAPDDPDTGGLLDTYRGIEHHGEPVRPPQVDQMEAMVGSRPVDALLVSIGANDIRFSEVVKQCIASTPLDPRPCHQSATASNVAARLGTLPARYQQLEDRLAQSGVPDDRVFITEYFDPTTDDLGIPNLRCIAETETIGDLAETVGDLADVVEKLSPDPRVDKIAEAIGYVATVIAYLTAGGVVTDDETGWARTSVIGALNRAVQAAAQTHGWNYVGGIANRFQRHGYCASDPWVVTLGETIQQQHDVDGAFHPDANGHRIYGEALFGSLSSSLLIPARSTGPDAAAGPASLGDLMVMTSGGDYVTSTAVALTGGAPTPLGTRRIDRLALGDGYLALSGPPAVERGIAVGLWHQVSRDRGERPRVSAARLGVRPNVAVLDVDVVQAPTDATKMVADRPTLVRAVLDATIAERTTIDVTTTVTAFDGSGTKTTLIERTDAIVVEPGQNLVILPRNDTFTAAEDLLVSARVEVTDPLGATAADQFDDVWQSGEVTTLATRPLRLLIGTTAEGLGGVKCQDASGTAARMVAFAREAMPIDAAGIDAELFCGLIGTTPRTEAEAVQQMLEWEDVALYTGHDAVVMLVPGGVLQRATGAIGIAAHGVRAVIVEATAPNFTLAHELTHMFGRNHSTPAEATQGVLVSRRAPRAGDDWMAAVAPSKGWTSAVVWDRLARLIGGPSATPAPVSPNGDGVWVRGTAQQDADGNWVIEPGSWIPADVGRTGTPLTDGDLDDLELERLVAQPIDANGASLGDATKVTMSEVGGLFPAGSTPGDGIGFVFGEFVPLPSGTAAVQLLIDGTLATTVEMNAAPTLAVIAPAAGTEVARGDELKVSWTASDPNGDALTFDVLISDDDGATWQPLSLGVTGTDTSAALPDDIGGDTVRVRVIASDGSRYAEATSQRFSAEPPALGTERVVFVRRMNGSLPADLDLYTTAPDGSGPTEVPLPETFGPIPGECSGQPCPAEPVNPSWGAGVGIVFASTYTTAADATTFGGISGGIFSVQPDGTGLTRLTPHFQDTTWWGVTESGQSRGTSQLRCPTVSPDGTSLAWITVGQQAVPATVWVSKRSGPLWLPPTPVLVSGSQPSIGLTTSHPTPTAPPFVLVKTDYLGTSEKEICPIWSPDSSALAMVVTTQMVSVENGSEALFTESAAATVRADGTDLKIVSPRGQFLAKTGGYVGKYDAYESVVSVAWRNAQTLTASRLFVDLSQYNPAAGDSGKLVLHGIFDLDIATSIWTRLTPTPDPPYYPGYPRPLVVAWSPTGQLYGRDTYISDPTFATNSWRMGIITPGSGAVDPVDIDLPEPSFLRNQYWSFDWGIAFGGGPATPQVTFDPNDAPPPGDPPDTSDVTVVTLPGPPAPDADTVPATPAVEVIDPGPVTAIAGRTTTLQLRATGPVAGFDAFSLDTDSLDLVVDGDTLRITPQPGVLGPRSFEVWALGNLAGARRVEVDVVLPPPPRTTDDAVTVRPGIEEIVDPAVLLANDAPGLRIVAVTSPDAVAWLDGNGIIRVFLSDPTAAAGVGRTASLAASGATFTYTVSDAEGVLGAAQVTVSPTIAPATTTSPPTTSPTTTPPTPPTTPTTTPPGGALPTTGSSALDLMLLAVVVVTMGLSARALTRRTRLR
jgi:hypothetical protein